MNRFIFNRNLQTKLVGVIIISTITPLLLLGFFTYQYIAALLQDEMSQNEQTHLHAVSNQLSYLFTDIEQLTLYFSRNSAVQDTLKKDASLLPIERYTDYQLIDEIFHTAMGVKNWTIDLYLTGENGSRYFSNEYLPKPYDSYKSNWGIFRKANEAQGMTVWDTNYSLLSQNTDEVVLTAARLITDPISNEKLGYIIVDVHEETLSAVTEDNMKLSTEQVFVLDDNGYVLSSTPDKASIGSLFDSRATNEILSASSGSVLTTWEGVPSVLSYETSSDNAIKLVSLFPTALIDEKNSLIGNLTLHLALLFSILSIWLAYYLSKTVVRPLYKLMSLMRQVERGDLDVRFDSQFHDDIGVFGRRFNEMLRQLKRSIQESYEKQVRLKDAELRALRAQINPHFLYNTLETVNWMARLRGSEDISQIVVSLSSIMKYSVRKGEGLVPVKEDVQQLKNYLNIQEFRFKDKFDVEITQDDTLSDELIPALLLQPLVENAIVHSLENRIEKGTIWITLKDLGEDMEITIRDNGTGMDTATLERVNAQVEEGIELMDLGIGLENVKKRLYLYYDRKFFWNMTSSLNEGTTIRMVIPKGGNVRDDSITDRG